MIGRLVKHCLTCADNETYDDARVLAVTAILVALGCTIYTVWRSGTFDMQAYGLGVGGLFAGLGGYMKLRGDA